MSNLRNDALKEKLNQNFTQFLFDPIVTETFVRITGSFSNLLKAEENIDEFTVLCNETNNTEERTANGELWLDIAVIFEGDDYFTYFPMRVGKETYNGNTSSEAITPDDSN